MTPPTTAQQRGLAFAPMPFAVISFVSSSYVVYHILYQQPKKRKRLYHRLVLAMNFALLPLSFTYAWSTLAVPKGTPDYAAAMGTVNTCTAQGFISLMFTLTVPIYYGSFVLQAYMGIKNNFNEEKYRWIETPVHIVAYCFPCMIAITIAATQNFNPNGSGCWFAKSPRGCGSDPEVPCERGKDMDYFVYIVGFSQAFLYIVFPPSVILAMHCWMKKLRKMAASSRSIGMATIREAAKGKMMHSIYRQISVYLVSFWISWVFSVIHYIYGSLSGNMAYNFLIFSNCIFASQGFIYALGYFTLQRMGKVDILPQTAHRPGLRHELTVSDIRSNVKGKKENVMEEVKRESFNFNIFDGTPDQDSPWARFIDEGDYDEHIPDEEKVDDHEQNGWNES